jgi:DNA-binding NtrC family response regulator
VDHFLGIFAARYKRERKSITKAALRHLSEFSWPGNVRQLEHVLLNAWILGDEPDIDVDDIELPEDAARSSPPAKEPSAPPHQRAFAVSSAPRSDRVERAAETLAPRSAPDSVKKGTLSDRRRTEKDRIIEALEACNWNRVKAAELSGIPRRTFYRRLREYKIQ